MPLSVPPEDRHFAAPPRSPEFAPWRGPGTELNSEIGIGFAYLAGPFFLAQRQALAVCRSLMAGPSRHAPRYAATAQAAPEPRPAERPEPPAEPAPPPEPGRPRRDQARSPSYVPPRPPYPPVGTPPPPMPDGTPWP